MTTKIKRIIGSSGANIRSHPSCEKGEIVKKLPFGANITVITDWTAVNTSGGDSTIYMPILIDDAIYYVSAKLVGDRITRLKTAEDAAKNVYTTIEKIKAKHASGAKSFNDIVAKKVTTCSSSASSVLQAAGCLQVGVTISHTDADGKNGDTKTTKEKVIKGYQNLISGTYTLYPTYRVYKDLPENLKKAGMVYIQDSNICVSAGNGYIWSCNNTGSSYGEGGMTTKRNSGYPFKSKILYVVEPKGYM